MSSHYCKCLNFLKNETNLLTLWLPQILLVVFDATTFRMITKRHPLALISEPSKFPRSHDYKEPTTLSLTSAPPSPGRTENSNLNVYFHISLWCLERFYEGLKGLHKTF